MNGFVGASSAAVFGPLVLLVVPLLTLAWCGVRLSRSGERNRRRTPELQRDLHVALRIAAAGADDDEPLSRDVPVAVRVNDPVSGDGDAA